MVLVQPYVYEIRHQGPPCPHHTPYLDVAQRSRVSSGIEWSIKKNPSVNQRLWSLNYFLRVPFEHWISSATNTKLFVDVLSNVNVFDNIPILTYTIYVHYYFYVFFFFFLSIMHSSVWLATDKLSVHQSHSAPTQLRSMLIYCTHFSICVSRRY